MSADAAAVPVATTNVRIIRYAVGSTVAMAVAMGVDWQLSFLVPVLSLSFLASPDPCPKIREGLAFVAVISVASLAGLLLSRWLLPYPFVFIPFVSLVLFRLFYAKTSGRSPLLIMWLMIALLVIPLVALLSPDIAIFVALGIPTGAAATIVLVWIAYLFFPDPEVLRPAAATAATPPTSRLSVQDRLRIAVEATAVVVPVFIFFYTLQLTGSVLILVFIALLSSQPGFAQNYKAGAALIVANVIGGIVAIVFYELLVVVPEFVFLILLTLLLGLIFGSIVFSGKPKAPLFGMAFSTVLLVVGSTTSGNGEAGAKVYTRVLQIVVAVTYVVTAFGTIAHFRRRGVD